MSFRWYDVAGTVGVAMIVVAYLLLQLRKLQSSDVSYLALNGFGAALVLLSLLFAFNLSAFVMESFWLLISVFGLVKNFAQRTSEQ
jgi:hypothetical protein